MRQTFLYDSTDCLRIVHPPPSHNLKWLFFRLFPHNSYHRGRSNDLLNEGNILIYNDNIAMMETLSKNDAFLAKFARICRNWFIYSSAMLIFATGAKNLELWPRPQNSVFKDGKNNGGEVGDLAGPRWRWRGQPRCPPWLRYCISL